MMEDGRKKRDDINSKSEMLNSKFMPKVQYRISKCSEQRMDYRGASHPLVDFRSTIKHPVENDNLGKIRKSLRPLCARWLRQKMKNKANFGQTIDTR